MAITVTRTDLRYRTLMASRNQRWPAHPSEAASRIELCETGEQAAEALQRIVRAGLRPTIRSGGHCYEDFVVNNPSGAILDLSLLTNTLVPGDNGRYRISPGQQLGEVYIELYKKYGVFIPAGSCYTVGAGGHISGGGYGVLSRLHGLTIDYLTEVEILTVDGKGDVELRRVNKDKDPDLFRACRGAGGGGYGVITGFLFDKLPVPPTEIADGHISFDWKTMTEQKLADICMTYGDYWATRGLDHDTWGLFTVLDISHSSSGRFGVGAEFCNPDGTCDDLSVLEDFLGRFKKFAPADTPPPPSEKRVPQAGGGSRIRAGSNELDKRPWLEATISGSGSGGSNRAKYKSCYMKKNFTREETNCIYKYMTKQLEGVELRGAVLAVDSYGGAANDKSLIETTAVPQRSSIMKLQWQHYWHDAAEDEARLRWTREFFTELYSQHVAAPHAGTPYPNEYYEGCYINYPDVDMLAYDFWPEVYFGADGLYPFLQKVKKRYDPNNVFHHAMSVRA